MQPKNYLGVMVSSTFTDLQVHRRALLDAIAKFELMPVGMENDGARADVDVIDSSLKFVCDAAAYICVIGHRYGQTPVCPERNPEGLSITELEFNEAIRLDRPILLFLMHEDRDVKKSDVEQDLEKTEKLERFIERAKVMREGSSVHRVYETFSSPEDFASRAGIAVGRLADLLKKKANPEPPDTGADEPAQKELTRPNPPELCAVPRYIGSHKFVGRTSELKMLDAWAADPESDPMLLFEAIGGSGKSMLTWEWVNNRAPAARHDWAGRFWYSFYERGARMVDFCQHALAYMTGKPRDHCKRLQIFELSERLAHELEQRHWLLVLDGLERVLVKYNRGDASQLLDEEVDEAGDQISNRDPRAAIRPADDDLLRRLVAVDPSKILVTSRLLPRALINSSGKPMPGVRHEKLQGLRPADAEALMRGVDIRGDGKAIHDYVRQHCDCHPLVVGALAGLVNDHIPDPGNFDAWVDAPDGGRGLNLADLDLVQKRNHILDAAMEALTPEALRLLQMLALLLHGADYELLQALNPHLPPKAEDDVQPSEAMIIEAVRRLKETVLDLQHRGLLQYEPTEKRYDLHPVVRGVAAGRMGADEKKVRGEPVVNYFTRRSPSTWDNANSLDDLTTGLQLVATLTQLGLLYKAFCVFQDGLGDALLFNFHAHAEVLALLRSFFPQGWDGETVALDHDEQAYLFTCAAGALADIDGAQAQRLIERSLRIVIAKSDVRNVVVALGNLTASFKRADKTAARGRALSLALDLAIAARNSEQIFVSLKGLFSFASDIGDHCGADRLWSELNSMNRPWCRQAYRPGEAETCRAFDRWRRGDLTEDQLAEAERLARKGRNRQSIGDLAYLRGRFHLERGEAVKAIGSLDNAVRMAREVGSENSAAEACLALARLHADETFDARAEAQRLNSKGGDALLAVAELWRELGETERAITAALRVHKSAVTDGEPYVFRHELDRARALLADLGAELPDVPQYDPANDPPFDWEVEVRNMIEALKARRAKVSEIS